MDTHCGGGAVMVGWDWEVNRASCQLHSECLMCLWCSLQKHVPPGLVSQVLVFKSFYAEKHQTSSITFEVTRRKADILQPLVGTSLSARCMARID